MSLLYDHVSLDSTGIGTNFSLPVSSKFAILHIDLWIIGHHVDSNGYMAFMNVMCEMSQFVVVVPGTVECSAILASYYIQYWLMLTIGSLPIEEVGTLVQRSKE